MDKRRVSPSMAVAFGALFVALAGTGVAAVSLSNNSVKTQHIAPGAVRTADIANNAVTGAKIKNGSVVDADIAGVAGSKVTGKVDAASKADSATSATNATTAASATTATNATNATNAASAANADKLDNLDSLDLKSRWVQVAQDGSIIAQSGGIAVTRGFAGGYYVNFGSSVATRALTVSIRYPDHGMASVALCGGVPLGAVCVVGDNTTNSVYVETKDTAGATVDRRFYLVASA